MSCHSTLIVLSGSRTYVLYLQYAGVGRLARINSENWGLSFLGKHIVMARIRKVSTCGPDVRVTLWLNKSIRRRMVFRFVSLQLQFIYLIRRNLPNGKIHLCRRLSSWTLDVCAVCVRGRTFAINTIIVHSCQFPFLFHILNIRSAISPTLNSGHNGNAFGFLHDAADAHNKKRSSIPFPSVDIFPRHSHSALARLYSTSMIYWFAFALTKV